MFVYKSFKRFFTVVLIFSSFTLYAKVESTFLNEMRTLSESRGMLWQAYKSYLMIGTSNNYENPKKELKESINSFEKAIKEVKLYAKKRNLTKILPLIKEIDNEWIELKKLLTSSPSKDRVSEIDKKSMKITNTIGKALEIMGSYDKSGDWKYLEQIQNAQNIAHRMATLYLGYLWQAIDKARYDSMMGKAVNEYENIIKFIQSSKYDTPEVEKLINHASKDYQYFKMMWKAKNKIFIPTLIYQRSSEMAEHMQESTDIIMAKLKE